MAMQKPKDWENVKATVERVALPVGAYICKIVGAKVVDYKDKQDESKILFSRLEIALDICEGEYAGHYQTDFDAQKSEDKKWKGVLRVYLPKEDGSEKDGWTKSSLKALIEAIEESNIGYHFDWDEKTLKGKKIGVLFRNEQWVMDAKSGWKAQPFKALAIDRVRDGKFTLPAEKANKSAPVNIDISVGADDFSTIADDEDLPF